MITQDKFEKIIIAYNNVLDEHRNTIVGIADDVCITRGQSSRGIDGDNISFYGREGEIRVEVKWEDYCCGSSSTEAVTFPLNYLWDASILEEEKALAAKKKKEKELADQQYKAQQAAREKKEEYAKYLKLKEQYEGKV